MSSKFGRTFKKLFSMEATEKMSNIEVVGTTTTFKGDIETETYPSLDDELDKIQNMIIEGTKTIFAGDLQTENFSSVDDELNKIPVINNKIQNLTTDGTKTIFSGDIEITTINGEPFVNGGGGGGEVDLTDLSGETAKSTDLVLGETKLYTAKEAIAKGQPVALEIDSLIKITAITSSTAIWRYLGIATNSANAGEAVSVCKKGFCNAKKTTTLQAPEIKLLNSASNNTTPIGQAFHLKDSGADNNYSSNENYMITFDCQDEQGWELIFNNFAFEHTTSSMYDRFSIQSSSDGVNYSNVSIPWLQKSATSTPNYSTSFAGGSWNSSTSKNGYILPQNTPRAILLGWDEQPTQIADRFIRFRFTSDGSAQDIGWDINLRANSYSGGEPAIIPLTSPLYIDDLTYDKLTTQPASFSAHLFGYTASNQSNDEIYTYLI
jgi:hypothetical protein